MAQSPHLGSVLRGKCLIGPATFALRRMTRARDARPACRARGSPIWRFAMLLSRRTFAVAAATVVSVVCSMSSPSSGQVFFAPVQYQYGPKPTFYYGGSNPRVFERMAQAGALEYGNSRTGWHEGVP